MSAYFLLQRIAQQRITSRPIAPAIFLAIVLTSFGCTGHDDDADRALDAERITSEASDDRSLVDDAENDLRLDSSGHDWPSFLGPLRNGKSRELGLSTDWGTDGPEVVWRRPVGEGYSAPSVADGQLYFFDRQDDMLRLTALDALTGEPLWQQEYATSYEDLYDFSNGPRAVPTIDDDRVFTYGPAGVLRAHATDDGELLWQVDTIERYSVIQNFFGVGSTPIIEGELLIAMVGGSPEDSPDVFSGKTVGNGSGLVAFDKATGEERYRLTDELASYSSPIVRQVGDRRLGFAFLRRGLAVFDAQLGKLDAFYPFRSRRLYTVNAATPVVQDNRVLITESYDLGAALLEVGENELNEIWRDPPRRNQSLASHWSTPILHQGVVYGSHGENAGRAELRAVDWSTGDVLWSEPDLQRTTQIYVDDHLVVLSESGKLYLIEATGERYVEVASSDLRTASDDGSTPGLQAPAWNAPVLAQGLLYVVGRNQLIALDVIADGT